MCNIQHSVITGCCDLTYDSNYGPPGLSSVFVIMLIWGGGGGGGGL